MKLGFGTYRIADGNFSHEQALRYALDNGIKVIDTSTNYTGGLSELLIGKVIADYDRKDITIISKFGYIQGALLEEIKERKAVEEVVEYDPSCWHSLHPDFLVTQLSRSLERLNCDYIDTYLLHNPEYYLMANIKEGKDIKYHQKVMFERIYKAFVTLEEEVKKGRIRSYGISSNSFALKEDDPHFLPYDALVDVAKIASEEAGSETHHFTAVQLPINMVETEGLKCAKWAKSEGLTVITNRPLNAFKENLMYRLATYDLPSDYEGLLNETINFLQGSGLDLLATIITELDSVVHRFGWVGEYENFLMQQVMPAFQKAFQSVPENDREVIAQSLEHFLNVYEQQVAFESSKTTLSSLKALGIDVEAPIQKDALGFLLKNSDIDVVLLGMRKIKYVQDALEIEAELS